MILLELGGAAIGGAVIGWLAHALLRGHLRQVTLPKREDDGAPSASKTVVPNPSEPSPSPRQDGPTVSSEADTAGRVILHLAGLGRLAYDEVGLIGHTQGGMCDALSIRQGTLTKILSRLIAAKVIEVDRRHVHGQPRRLNVYRLTAMGESVAREIRSRRISR